MENVFAKLAKTAYLHNLYKSKSVTFPEGQKISLFDSSFFPLHVKTKLWLQNQDMHQNFGHLNTADG